MKISNKGMVYIFDIMIIFGILFHMGAVFSTSYMMGLQHTPDTQVVEVNPVTRNSGIEMFEENKQEVYEPTTSLFKEYLQIKWSLWVTMIITYSMIAAVYIMNRRAVVKKNYEDCSELWMLCFMAIFTFLLFMKDFLNDIGYIIGAIRGGGL